jgi:VWFA-related protein
VTARLGALALVAPLLALQDAPQEVRRREHVEVERVVVDVRVLADDNRALRGLTATDFAVRVDGRRVAIESADWAGGTPAIALAPEAAALVPGRSTVFFFQKDLHPSRTPGLFRMQDGAVHLLDTMGPEDRVAVASFDHHLELWCDFTSERETLRRIIQHSILFERRPTSMVVAEERSLARFYDPAAGRAAATPEEALEVLARALENVPGAKSIAFFGWGLGRLTGGIVLMEPSYPAMVQALVRSRTTVFALDVTDADFHSLETGMQQIAEDTGGFYAKTHVFPAQALASLEGALAGYYVLTFEGENLRPGRHDLAVDLHGRKGRLLAPPQIEITAPQAP